MAEEIGDDTRLFSKDQMEGEYRTWQYVWTQTAAWLWAGTPAIVDNYGNCALVDTGIPTTHFYDRAGNTFNVANWRFYQGDHYRSVNGKYVIIHRPAVGGQTTFRIYRRYVLYYTYNITADNPNWNDITKIIISPNGKYLSLMVWNAVLATMQLVLYEGVP